jgi:hypothetical protein
MGDHIEQIQMVSRQVSDKLAFANRVPELVNKFEMPEIERLFGVSYPAEASMVNDWPLSLGTAGPCAPHSQHVGMIVEPYGRLEPIALVWAGTLTFAALYGLHYLAWENDGGRVGD